MRVDLTLDGPAGPRDVALSAGAGSSSADVCAALRTELGVADDAVLSVDGTRLDPALPWFTQVRTGAVVRAGRRETALGGTMRLTVAAGLDAGRVFDVPRSACIGRDADCDIVLIDPDVSRRHVVVTNERGSLRLEDAGSTNGTWIDGARIVTAALLRPGQWIRIGNTVLRADSGIPLDAGLLAAAAPRWPEPPPPAHQTPIPVAASLTSLGAALAIGTLAHSMRFLAISLLTPVVLLAAAWATRWRQRQRAGRMRRTHLRDLERARRELDAALTAEALRRRDAHPDATALLERPGLASPTRLELAVRVGVGDSPAQLSIEQDGARRCAGVLPLVPVLLDLAVGVYRFSGDRQGTARLCRWLLLQVCLRRPCEALEVQLLLDPRCDDDWTWARWLPHVRSAPLRRTPAGARVAAGPSIVVIDRASAGRNDGDLADAFPGAVVLVLGDGGDGGAGGQHLHVSADGLLSGLGADGTDAVVADGVSAATAERLARRCAAVEPSGRRTQNMTGLLDLMHMGSDVSAVHDAWQRGMRDDGLRAVVGVEQGEPFGLDLHRDGPHALVVGTTGSGKSELLRTWVAAMALTLPPDLLSFVLIDYKGGAAFGLCADLPHVSSVLTDLDPGGARRALQSLQAELRRREILFARLGAASLDEYYLRTRPTDVARLVIMVDEFAALAQDQSDFLNGLVGVAQRGRSLGIHLVLATQRAGSAITSDIRANATLRIALRVTDPNESHDLLGVSDAAHIPVEARGAAVVLDGSGIHAVRAAHVSARASPAGVTITPLDNWRRPTSSPLDDGPSELEAVVGLVRQAAAAQQRAGHPAPWLPALPDELDLETLGVTPHEPSPSRQHAPFGLVDLPDEQQQPLACVDLRGSTILFTGPPRSGRTTGLVTVVRSAAERLRATDLAVYVIDAGGGQLAGRLADLAHVATVSTVDASEHVARLVLLLREEVRRRQRGAATGSGDGFLQSLVVVDDHQEFVRRMDAFDNGCTAQALAEIVAHGPAVGFSVALSDDSTAPLRTRLAVDQTYLLGGEAAPALGSSRTRPAHTVPPGRCRRSSDGAWTQIAHGADLPAAQAPALDPAAPERIIVRPLPDRILLESLPATTSGFVLGVGGDAAQPITVDLGGCTHSLLVAGPPSSGRSTCLVSLLRQALALALPVCVAADDRSPISAVASAAGLAVVSPWESRPAIECAGGVLFVDDIERFLDRAAGDALSAAIADPERRHAVVASGEAVELSMLQRPAITRLRQDRTAVLLQPRPIDGELAAVRLPRTTAPAIPGRGVFVHGGLAAAGGAGAIALQIALPAGSG